MLAGACLLVAALSGCGSTPAATPSMWTPDPTQAPPTGEAELATAEATVGSTEQQSQAPEVVPSAEAPASSLPPVAQPPRNGGPWTTVDVTATSASQVMAATSLPETLRAFLTSRIGIEDDAGCTASQISVNAVHADGFAFGTEESNCGGSQVVWGITESQWHYIVAFEDAIPCREFTLNDVPTGVPGLRCLDAEGTAADY